MPRSMKERLQESLNLIGENFSGEELATIAEAFCSLNFADNQELKDQQAEVSEILAECFEHGNAELGLAPDIWKAKKYGKPFLPKKTWKSTERAYALFGWFTSIRLFLLRLNRVLDQFGKGFYVNTVVDVGNGFFNTVFNAVTNNITTLTSIAGLSYGLELLFDSAVLFKAAFLPTEKQKANNPSRWGRFVNTLKKDDRIIRMANAAYWFGVNLAGFLVSGGISAILNISVFVIDVCADVYKYYRDKHKYDLLAKVIQKKKADIQNELTYLSKDSSCYFSKQKELQKYNHMEERLNEKTKAISNKRLYAIGISLAILAGMALFLFPPAGAAAVVGLVAVKAIGASIAMLCSVFGGLGKRVFEKITAPKEIDKEIEALAKPPVKHITLPSASPTKAPANSASFKDTKGKIDVKALARHSVVTKAKTLPTYPAAQNHFGDRRRVVAVI
jgi:hypothetical protein